MEGSRPDISLAANRLSEAIRFRTVSSLESAAMPNQEFLSFQAWLALAYPKVHAAARRETFGPWGILYRLPGKDTTLKPIILLAHYDVVPAENPGSWRHPPFEGAVADGYVWGRGTLDVKNTLVSIMEAMESLLEEGFEITRGIIVAFGGDEEVGGSKGAASIAKRLADDGLEAEFLLDEGSAIMEGSFPFLKRPAALIGLSEKGFLNLSVTVKGKGGHASMPGRGTAAGALARALSHLEKHPFPARLTGTLRVFLKSLARHAPPILSPFLAHPGFFWPVIRSILSRGPRTDALIRTTQAITMLKASPKENVLPDSANAVVNVRILPGESVAGTLARARKLLLPFGAEVEIYHIEHMNEPMPESPFGVPSYAEIADALREVAPEALPLPFLVTVGTDTHHYASLTRNIFRIMPIILDECELARIHAVDERISIENLGREIAFYRRLIRGRG